MAFDRYQDTAYVRWAIEIKSRSNQTCELCGKWHLGGKGLRAHHLDSWDWAIDKRYDLNNGFAICHQEHELFHRLYSFGSNTREQFEAFKQSYNLIKRAIKDNGSNR